MSWTATPEELLGKNGSRPHRPPAPAADAIEELAQGARLEARSPAGPGGGSQELPRRRARSHFPMRDAAGNTIGTRRRQADGRPFSDGGKVKCVQGSKQGLLCPWPISRRAGTTRAPRRRRSRRGRGIVCRPQRPWWPRPARNPPSSACSELQLIVARRDVVMFPRPG